MGRRGDRVGLASGPKTKHLDIVSCQYLYKMSKKVFFSGWLDQPFVSKYWPGAVITISIERALGWKLAGAGGGGYLVLVSERPIANAIKIRIRRERPV